MEAKVTVLTPTYNRMQTLPRLYQSLQEQTNYYFEWLIVDDGGADDTEKLVKEWIETEKDFPIRYIKKKNGGKHTAVNEGIEKAEGVMTIIVDSDDYLTKDAIQKIQEKEEQIKDYKDFAGIAFAKGYSDTKLVGTTFEGEYVDATSLERKKYHIHGDKAEVFYTQILKNNKFPEFEGEKFVTEALVWNRIAKQGYKLRWFQDIIYICEYLEGGLTNIGDKIYANSPKGLLTYVNESIENFHMNWIRRALYYELYSRAIYENKQIKKAAKELKIKPFTLRLGILLRKIVNLIRR